MLGIRGESWSWNDQYRRGRWNCIATGRRSKIVSLVEENARGGRIVELGCGEGTLICGIDPDKYDSYLGIDLSDVAVERAGRKTRECGLLKCQFEVASMTEWNGGVDISLIIMEESLYYLNSGAQRKLIEVCLNSLRPAGFLLVALHSHRKHQATMDTCKQMCQSAIEIVDGDSVYLLLREKRSESM